ncbi:hypothetical protein ODE01S_04920 [Oceanithermus desulfurans NBRC 100063]|uniref:Uncharacterized protein n=1 Tax=Oceanithermus desulfurans NBRC 100063 TaxID=1227550 RepID=A0A511RHE1_9DEIN|nr:hypothetical protein ODE01S_04920 [Oceanithermus desulfurans NBRC 100063]
MVPEIPDQVRDGPGVGMRKVKGPAVGSASGYGGTPARLRLKRGHDKIPGALRLVGDDGKGMDGRPPQDRGVRGQRPLTRGGEG